MQTKILTLAIASSLVAGVFALAPTAQAKSPAPQPAATHAAPAAFGPANADQQDYTDQQDKTNQQNNDEMAPNDTINCQMDFTLSGWSVFYKTASGNGTIRCDNGKTMKVVLNVKGGGLTVGAYKINDGHGDFDGVSNIRQVLGSYANATAHAGAVKSSRASVMTKNNVTLTLTGTGNGWNIGAGFSGFTIKRADQAGMDTTMHNTRNGMQQGKQWQSGENQH